MTVKWDVLKDTRNSFLIVALDNATMTEQTIKCSVHEALDLMWKIHAECGGNGTINE